MYILNVLYLVFLCIHVHAICSVHRHIQSNLSITATIGTSHKWSLKTGGAHRHVDSHIIPSPGISKGGVYIQVELRAGSTVYTYVYIKYVVYVSISLYKCIFIWNAFLYSNIYN